MLKRIFFAAMTVMMMTAVFVHADSYKVRFNYCTGVSDEAIAVIFDESNKLSDIQPCKVYTSGGVCTVELSGAEAENVRLIFPFTKTVIRDFIKETNSNDTNPDDKYSCAAYPTELDAATAYMMVKDVSSAAVGDELKTKLDVLFKGEERELFVDEDIKIYSAPVINDALCGEPVSALKPGDIIFCGTNLSGKLRTLELIYRPAARDIVTDTADFGRNFELLYTLGDKVTKANGTPFGIFGGNNNRKRQYAFGLIKDVYSDSFTICNKEGLAAQDIDVDFTPDTIVYVYDKAKKNGNVHIGDISDIIKSGFGRDAMDDLDNIVDWSNDFEHHYALVRMSEGTAMEIALYLNY